MNGYEVIGVSKSNGGVLECVMVELQTPQGSQRDAAPINGGDLGKALLAAIMRVMDSSVPSDPGWIFDELGASLQAEPASAYELFAPSAKTYRMHAVACVRTPAGRHYRAAWEDVMYDHLKAMAIVVLDVVLQHEATKSREMARVV
jgi:hypothetical protein